MVEGSIPSGKAAAGASAAASSGSLGSLPAKAAKAAVEGDEGALLSWLDSGGRVNATGGAGNLSGTTTLMLAASNGHERVVELLLQRGAEVNQQNSDGGTALMIAAGRGQDTGWNPWLDGDDDGVVRVEETRLAGAADELTVRGVHTLIMRQPEVIQACLDFLDHRTFAPTADEAPGEDC